VAAHAHGKIEPFRHRRGLDRGEPGAAFDRAAKFDCHRGTPGILLAGPIEGRYPSKREPKSLLTGALFFSGPPLHLHPRLKAIFIAIDRSDGHDPAVQFVAHDAIALHYVAIDIYCVPLLGVTDIIDGDVVVLAPEKRCRCEWRADP